MFAVTLIMRSGAVYFECGGQTKKNNLEKAKIFHMKESFCSHIRLFKYDETPVHRVFDRDMRQLHLFEPIGPSGWFSRNEPRRD
jgi:hypothetical protein